MKILLLVLLLLIPGTANADRRSDFIDRSLEYAGGKKLTKNVARINAYAVNQEKLDMYRAAHPRYHFPAKIKDLNEKQAEQVLSYFWDNYRFGDYKYDEIQEKVWDMMTHMSMADLEREINECIRKYYHFGKYYEGADWAKKEMPDFYAPFGSVSSVSLLNGMPPKDIPDFLLILNAVEY
ncbi:hypothetical protein HDR61_03065 [bacterium]|nr:hypothetical protein [bacterium]